MGLRLRSKESSEVRIWWALLVVLVAFIVLVAIRVVAAVAVVRAKIPVFASAVEAIAYRSAFQRLESQTVALLHPNGREDRGVPGEVGVEGLELDVSIFEIGRGKMGLMREGFFLWLRYGR